MSYVSYGLQVQLADEVRKNHLAVHKQPYSPPGASVTEKLYMQAKLAE